MSIKKNKSHTVVSLGYGDVVIGVGKNTDDEEFIFIQECSKGNEVGRNFKGDLSELRGNEEVILEFSGDDFMKTIDLLIYKLNQIKTNELKKVK